jgi:hypothetical protein
MKNTHFRGVIMWWTTWYSLFRCFRITIQDSKRWPVVLSLPVVGHCEQVGSVSVWDYVPIVALVEKSTVIRNRRIDLTPRVLADGGAVRAYYPTIAILS